MIIPIPLVLGIAGLWISAVTRINGVILGQHFSIPVMGLIGLIVLAVAIGGVLYFLRSMARDGWPWIRPRAVSW